MIRLTNVTKIYNSKGEERVVALDNISLSIQQKGLTVFTGTSGCGKTTLLNLLSGFDTPTEGCVSVFGSDLQTLSGRQLDDFRLNKLGFVFQDFNLIEDFSVEENIRLPLEMKNVEQNEVMKAVQDASEKTNIEELLKKKVSHLSGGQKQRVAIARSIVKKPDIILADEPTGNLDGQNSRMIFELLKNIAKDCAVIVVTHDVELAREYADRVITLSYGKIIEDSEKALDLEEKQENALPFNTSAKIPFKLGIKLAGNMLLRRSSRSLLTILILSLTISVFLVIVSIEKRNDAVAISEYLQSFGSGAARVHEKLSDELLSSLRKKEFNLEEGSIFLNDVSATLSENDFFLQSLVDIEYADMFISAELIASGTKRLSDLAGRTGPIMDNEIMLEAVLANELGIVSGELPVKMKIRDMEFVVVGIVDNFQFLGQTAKPIVFCTKTTWKQLLTESKLQNEGLGFGKTRGPLDQVLFYGPCGDANRDEYILLSGRKPQKKTEILISESECNILFENYESALGKEFRVYDLYDEKYEKVFADSVNLFDFCGDSVQVVGVASGEMNWYLYSDAYNAIKEVLPLFKGNIGIFLRDADLTQKISKMLENHIYVSDDNLELLYSEWKKTNEKLYALRSIAVVMSLLTVLQMISLLSFSIKDSKKTVGTFRALGATPFCITQIFALEGLVTTMASLILSLIATKIAINSMNADTIRKVYQGVKLRTIVPNGLAIVVVAIAVSAVAMCVVLIPIAKLNKTRIINLLK